MGTTSPTHLVGAWVPGCCDIPGVNAGLPVPQVGYLLVYDTTCSLGRTVPALAVEQVVPMAVPHSRYSYPLREDSELSSAAYSLCRTSYLIVVDYRGISGQSVIGGLVSKCRIHAAVNGGILSL